MAQIKIYGLRSHLASIRQDLSDVLHSCVLDALQFPADKRFHRFILLDREDFYFPDSRSEKYTIIEISMFEGRTIEAKKALMQMIFERFESELNILANDIEITIFETPRHNWGIRGKAGDELGLSYKVDI